MKTMRSLQYLTSTHTWSRDQLLGIKFCEGQCKKKHIVD
jgi:hypothetical protein